MILVARSVCEWKSTYTPALKMEGPLSVFMFGDQDHSNGEVVRSQNVMA